MKMPDVVSILRSISQKEAKAFSKYLATRIGESTQGFRLFGLLRKNRFDKVKGRIQQLAAALEVSESQLRNRLSDLLAFYEEYLAVCRIRSSPRLRAALALERAMETKHGEYLDRAIPRTDRLLTDGKFTSTYALYEYLRFKRVTHEFKADLSNEVGREELLDMYRVLEEFTLVEKSKLYLASMSGNLLLTEAEAPLGAEIGALLTKLSVAEDEANLTSPQNIYYHLFRIIHNNSADSFESLFQNIRQVLNSVSARDGKQVVEILFNTLALKINIGKMDYESQYRKLIVATLEFPEIRITEWLLKNFVTTLCRINDLVLAQRVLTVYLPLLPNSRIPQASNYNSAVIMMAQSRYEEAIALLNQVSLSNDTYYQGARYHLFRALYELKDYTGLLALLKSFRSYFIGLKGVPDGLLSASLNFLTFFSALVKLEQEKPYLLSEKYVSSRNKLEEKLLKADQVINRDWLLKKLRQP